jgi:hypothetical protein
MMMLSKFFASTPSSLRWCERQVYFVAPQRSERITDVASGCAYFSRVVVRSISRKFAKVHHTELENSISAKRTISFGLY